MYIKRDADKKIENDALNQKVLIVLGPRQIGKTTLIKKFLFNKRQVSFNFDIASERDKFLTLSLLTPADAMKNIGAPDFIFIDEAQRIPEVGRIVKGWYDSSIRAKIILAGSSNLNLLNQTAESLTGRNEKIYLPPLVFSEILEHQEWYIPGPTTYLSNYIKTLAGTCICFGMYPEVFVTGDKHRFLTNLVNDYLLKDIVQSGIVKDPETIRKLLLLLAGQLGSAVSVNELATNLGISRLTVERYISLLEATYVIFRLSALSSNPRKEISKSKKIYFWDTGVRNALLNDFTPVDTRADIGQLWENWVIAEYAKANLLTGQKKNLYFWKSHAGAEIDLVIKENENLEAKEIKWRSAKNKHRTAFQNKYPGVAVDVINFDSLPITHR